MYKLVYQGETLVTDDIMVSSYVRDIIEHHFNGNIPDDIGRPVPQKHDHMCNVSHRRYLKEVIATISYLNSKYDFDCSIEKI